jgi:predicted nucleotidyltransferase
MPKRIAVDRGRIAEFCRRHHIRRLALFGSILREDFRPDSDVDMLMQFEPGRVPGFFGLAGMEAERSDLLGWKVDLRTPNDLRRYFRDEVLATAKPLYDAAAVAREPERAAAAAPAYRSVARMLTQRS